jgi:hypothetical protein
LGTHPSDNDVVQSDTHSMFSPDVLERRQRLVHRWLRARGVHLTQKHAILMVIGILGLYNLTILQRLPAKVACPPLSLRRIGPLVVVGGRRA